MKVLLTTLNAKYIHINLAIRLLYELNADVAGLDWQEFTINEPQEGVAERCSEYDVVAFSCYIWNITQTIAVAQRIKIRNPNTKILLGGPEVSYDWQNVIALPQIDYIITGEGEIPFTQFLRDYPKVDLVPNLVYKIADDVMYLPRAATFDVANYAESMPERSLGTRAELS